MTQLSPTNLVYAQALEILDQLRRDYGSSKYKSPEEIIEVISGALTKFEDSVGTALTKFEPVYHSEVPSSQKTNRFWNTLQSDVNILQQQVDVLRSAAIFTHNFIKTEIEDGKKENLRLLGKLKTLELYANADNEAVLYFGDSFISDDFIDTSLIATSQLPALIGQGSLTLGSNEIVTSIDTSTTVTILPGSNGFAGNNQEVHDPVNAPTDPVTGDKIYTFFGELYNSSRTETVVDNLPNTWFEFEKYYINPNDRDLVYDYNFHYLVNDNLDIDYINETDSFSVDTNGRVTWADGINNGPTGTLKLNLQVDFGSAKRVNYITITPFGLTDNKNNPIKVSKVMHSADGSTWTTVTPENVWIANSIDRRISDTQFENIIIGQGTWVLKNWQNVRYVRFVLEQPNPIPVKVGHFYYLDEDYDSDVQGAQGIDLVALGIDPSNTLYEDDLAYDQASYLDVDSTGDADGINYGSTQSSASIGSSQTSSEDSYRRLGPIPPVTNPFRYADASRIANGGLIQKREYFEGLRWAIGLRDIELNAVVFNESSYFISNKLEVNGIVDRVALEADISIPDSFDTSTNWIKFYVSPDDGINWYQISRIQDDFLGLPEVIAFNDPTPNSLREPGVSYIETGETVSNLRLKVELSRPANQEYLTPVLHSYKLKVVKRV